MHPEPAGHGVASGRKAVGVPLIVRVVGKEEVEVMVVQIVNHLYCSRSSIRSRGK